MRKHAEPRVNLLRGSSRLGAWCHQKPPASALTFEGGVLAGPGPAPDDTLLRRTTVADGRHAADSVGQLVQIGGALLRGLVGAHAGSLPSRAWALKDRLRWTADQTDPLPSLTPTTVPAHPDYPTA